MISISRQFNTFAVKLEGDRKKYRADTVEAAAESVLHYYGAAHDVMTCALCAASNREAEARCKKESK